MKLKSSILLDVFAGRETHPLSLILGAVTFLATTAAAQHHLYTFNGDSANDYFGSSVSGAGDVNGDGYADLIVGARQDGNNGAYSGSARVLSGKDGKILYTFNGDSAGDYFGTSVSGAGDVNRDGYADLIVGANGDDNNKLTDSGSARVLPGRQLTFWSNVHEFSTAQGGTQTLTLNAGKQHANRFYWIFSSATDTTPGITLLGTHFPLNPDLYTSLTIGLANTPPFVNFKGQLDGNGQATASFQVPKLTKPLKGPITLNHAYLVYNAQGFWHMVSNAVPLHLRN